MQRSLEQEAAHNDRYLKQQQDNHLRGLGLFGNDETDAPTEDSDKDGIGLIESVPCEPDHSRAVDFVERYGDVKAGNAACASEADPDSCGGGCCRFGAFFVCDEDNRMAHLPCVCNRNTNKPKDYLISFSETEHEKAGEETADGPTAAPGMLDNLMGYLTGGETSAPADTVEKNGPMKQEFEEKLDGGGDGSDSADEPTDDSVTDYDSDSAGSTDDTTVAENSTESRSFVDTLLDTVGLGKDKESDKDFDPSQMLSGFEAIMPKSDNETDDSIYPEEYVFDYVDRDPIDYDEAQDQGDLGVSKKAGRAVNSTNPPDEEPASKSDSADNGGILGLFGIGGQDDSNTDESAEATKALAIGGEGSRKSIGSDSNGMFDFLNLTKSGDEDKGAVGGEGSRKSIGSGSNGMFDFLNLTKSGDDENKNCGGDSGNKCGGEPEADKGLDIGGEGMFDILNQTKSKVEDKEEGSSSESSSGMFDFLGSASETEAKSEEEGNNTTKTEEKKTEEEEEEEEEGSVTEEAESKVEREEEELAEAEEELSEAEKDLADIIGELSGGGR